MSESLPTRPIAILTLLVGSVAGCGDSRAVSIPKVDSQSVATQAIADLDVNADGTLDAQELSPALTDSLSRIDSNADGKLDSLEIASCVEGWRQSRAGMIPVRCVLTYRKKPLVGATVEFTPEPFLADAILPASGRTNKFGWATMSIPMELRQSDEVRGGIQFGWYRISVSKQEDGRETIPARFNTASQLGREISMDAPGVQSGSLMIDLQ